MGRSGTTPINLSRNSRRKDHTAFCPCSFARQELPVAGNSPEYKKEHMPRYRIRKVLLELKKIIRLVKPGAPFYALSNALHLSTSIPCNINGTMPEIIFSMSVLWAVVAVYENLENVLASLAADRRSSLTSFTTYGPEVAPGSGLLLTKANQATRT